MSAGIVPSLSAENLMIPTMETVPNGYDKTEESNFEFCRYFHFQCFCLGSPRATKSCPVHYTPTKSTKLAPIFEKAGEEEQMTFDDILDTTWPFNKQTKEETRKSLSCISPLLRLPIIKESSEETENASACK